MTASLHLTYAAVLLAVLAKEFCLPIPSVLFSHGWRCPFDAGKHADGIVVSLGVLACLNADGMWWFCFGRRWGSRVISVTLFRFTADPSKLSQNALQTFRR